MPTEITQGLYSNWQYELLGGPSGIAILLLNGNGQWFATVKCGGGMPFFRKISIDVNGNFSFSVEPEAMCGTRAITGNVSRQSRRVELRTDINPVTPVKVLPLAKALD